MSKTKNSRYKINEYLNNEFDGYDNVTVKFSRHKNSRKHVHSLGKEFVRTGVKYRENYDGRLGDCFMRSDRRRKGKNVQKGICRARLKEFNRKEIIEAV